MPDVNVRWDDELRRLLGEVKEEEVYCGNPCMFKNDEWIFRLGSKDKVNEIIREVRKCPDYNPYYCVDKTCDKRTRKTYEPKPIRHHYLEELKEPKMHWTTGMIKDLDMRIETVPLTNQMTQEDLVIIMRNQRSIMRHLRGDLYGEW